MYLGSAAITNLAADLFFMNITPRSFAKIRVRSMRAAAEAEFVGCGGSSIFQFALGQTPRGINADGWAWQMTFFERISVAHTCRRIRRDMNLPAEIPR